MQCLIPRHAEGTLPLRSCDSFNELVAEWNKLNESSMRLEHENQAIIKRILTRLDDNSQVSLEAKYKRLKRKYLALNLSVFIKANSTNIGK